MSADSGNSSTPRSWFSCACMATAPVTCATDQDCAQLSNSQCVDTTCRCVSGYVIVVGGYDVTAETWRRVCRQRKLYDDAAGCRGTVDCEAAVAGSYCEALSGQCRCRAGFIAGRTLNSSCARLSQPTCRTHVDCTDAIDHTRCDSSGRCQCDVRYMDDGTATACVLRPIGGFCHVTADCARAVPSSQCDADNRCECVSGFRAVDVDTPWPTCVRRRVGSDCHVTSDCSDAMTGSDCVRGACACRPEYVAAGGGGSCRRRRIDDDEDAACGGTQSSDNCEVMFDNSVCSQVERRCVCRSGHRPDDDHVVCVRRRRLSDQSPCRDHPDCHDAIPRSLCDPRTHRCACPAGYRPDHITTSGTDVCRRRLVGDRCSTDVDCSAILSATCHRSGFCACVTGYGIPPGGVLDCRRRRVGGEVGCEADTDCLEGIEFSVCRRGRCACLPGYMDVDNATTCVRRKLQK